MTGRGPYTVEDNRQLLRRFGIKVLVTKDSGDRGGVLEKLEAARLEGCRIVVVGRPPDPAPAACSSLTELISQVRGQLPAEFPTPPPVSVLALDLESVLAPELWQTVALAAGVHELAVTTRDIPDYDVLMQQRIRLCREHRLTLARLREIIATIEPLPGAREFLAWAAARMLTVIVSDTYYELAAPIIRKLGSPLLACNWLAVDAEGYISGYQLRSPLGKAGTVAEFRRLGLAVIAVGDSYNDLGMLQQATTGILYRPCPGVLQRAPGLANVDSLRELQNELEKHSWEEA